MAVSGNRLPRRTKSPLRLRHRKCSDKLACSGLRLNSNIRVAISLASTARSCGYAQGLRGYQKARNKENGLGVDCSTIII